MAIGNKSLGHAEVKRDIQGDPMKRRLDALIAIAFTSLMMWMLGKVGYLEGFSLVWRCLFAGALAGAMAFALRYIQWL